MPLCASGEFLENSTKAVEFDIYPDFLLSTDTDLPSVADGSVFVKPSSPEAHMPFEKRLPLSLW